MPCVIVLTPAFPRKFPPRIFVQSLFEESSRVALSSTNIVTSHGLGPTGDARKWEEEIIDCFLRFRPKFVVKLFKSKLHIQLLKSNSNIRFLSENEENRKYIVQKLRQKIRLNLG